MFCVPIVSWELVSVKLASLLATIVSEPPPPVTEVPAVRSSHRR